MAAVAIYIEGGGVSYLSVPEPTYPHLFRPNVERPHVGQAEAPHHVFHGGYLLAGAVDEGEPDVRIVDGQGEPRQPTARSHVQYFCFETMGEMPSGGDELVNLPRLFRPG